ncbi:MAG: oligosaccharide flippase family protein, partial [Candidatus Omnitrophica bacterium]|nr:oligosaccharide flippase family protein [Candidatus Omnitrophota bacterium]
MILKKKMLMFNKFYQKFCNLQEKVYLIRSVLKFKPFDISTEDGRSKERYRRVALTAGSTFVNRGVTILTGLISIPLTVHYLGAERYGLWMTISSVVAFLTFSDLGLGNGLLNAISRANGLDNHDEAVTAVSSVFFILTGIAVFLSVIFWIIYPHVSFQRIFNVTSDAAIRESGPAMAIFILIYLVNIPLGIIERIQMGFQEGYKNQLWLGIGAILGLAGVLTAIYFKAGLPWLVLAISGGPLLATLINGFYLFTFSRPYLFPKWRYFNLAISKNLIGVGVIFFVLQFFSVIGYYVDNIVIAQVWGASAVASYAVTKKLFSVTQINAFILQPLWPAFGEALTRKEYKWAKRTLIRTLKFSLSTGMLAALPLLIFGKSIISFWVGPQLVPSSALIIGFFFWVFLVNYGGTMSVFLSNDSLVRKQCFFIGITGISSIMLQIILVRSCGVAGAIWAPLIAYSLFFVIPAYRLAFGTLD